MYSTYDDGKQPVTDVVTKRPPPVATDGGLKQTSRLVTVSPPLFLRQLADRGLPRTNRLDHFQFPRFLGRNFYFSTKPMKILGELINGHLRNFTGHQVSAARNAGTKTPSTA